MIEANEMLSTLSDVIRRLDELGVAYMVTGSFAMSTYAIARTTLDIDIVIEVAGIDADRFTAKFEQDYYVSSESVERSREHGLMFNMLSNRTGIKIDCIPRKSDRFEREKFERRRLASLGGVEFWAIRKNDLIISKLRWAKDSHSELQFRDVQRLLESGVTDAEISSRTDEEGLHEVWEAFKEWTTQAQK